MYRRWLVVVGVAFALSACSASGMQVNPSVARPMSEAQTAPTSTPGDTATGLPGDTATGLPGAQLACQPVPQNGQASCTIAININIAPLNDPDAPPSVIPGYHPSDLVSAYDLPVRNAGGTVAIVDAYDDPAAEADLAIYRVTFGLPLCTSLNGCFEKLNESGQSGSLPPANASWSQEIALDLDMVSAACPNCHIVLVEANSASIDDLGAAVDTAAKLHPLAISNSYYASEWSGETAEDAHYAHRGIAITASSGDHASPFYPAASPYVTAIGGTTLALHDGRSEKAWAYGGHGCSRYEPKPAWQGAATCRTRSTVDVSAVADPQSGVAMFETAGGGWLVAGGTSVGAPLIAAAYALSANPQAPAYSYTRAGDFYELGGTRYAAATGLGSPDGISGL